MADTVRLEDRDGKVVVRLQKRPFQEAPDLIIWRGRSYVLTLPDCSYVEANVWSARAEDAYVEAEVASG